MVATELLSREEPLHKLESFCRNLNSVFNRAGVAPDVSHEIWRTGIDAQCVSCGIRLYGEELFALSQPPSEETASPKIGRLRLGDCARQTCSAYTYRLTFYPCNDLNWPEILTAIDADKGADILSSPDKPKSWTDWAVLLRSRQIRSVSIALGVLLLLVIARQWYVGGRIPVLREPRKFLLAPASLQPGPH